MIKEVVEKDTKETIKEVNFKEKFGFYSPSRGEGFFQMVENLRNEGFIISNKLVYDTYEEMKKQGKTGLSSSLQLFDIEKKDCKKYITSFTLNLVKLEKPVVTLTTVPTVPKVDQESEKEEVNMC
ncbi:MAG: hypothetical protein LRZ98_01620 [Candidatus Pacebacteria bacterium]|nr:hypothetical protein [Candidatus Paceibacterota bacterium]